MKFFDYLTAKIEVKEAELANEKRVRFYNDVAILLWYKILYDDVLAYKQQKMNEQQEPFCIYRWGDNNLVFGKVKALVSQADTDKFIKTAEAELRDRGYGDLAVKVYPDAIIVTKKDK